MIVVVPSRGRPDRCAITLNQMPDDLEVVLAVPMSEESDYCSRWTGAYTLRQRTRVVGVEYQHVGEKRQWIMENFGHGKIAMIDDDLRFRTRTDENRFVPCTKRDVEGMLSRISSALDDYAHVGVSDEFMCQQQPRDRRVGGRYNQVLAYNFVHLDPAPGRTPRFRLAINEEHDVHLQLLQQGRPALILTNWTKGSRYNAVGGCSTWRTPQFEADQFEEFRRLWPEYVRIVDGASSISGKSVRIAWRRAWRS